MQTMKAPFPDVVRYYQEFEYVFVFSKGKPKTINLLRQNKSESTIKRNNSGIHKSRHERYKMGKLKVIGVRKDGRFVAENSKGDKIQISDYELNDYMLLKPENEMAMNKLSELKAKEEQQRLENNETRKLIISEINIVTLKDYKKQLQ